MTSRVYYSLNTRSDDPQLQVINELPANTIHTVVYEVDEKVFPLKTREETQKYLSTLYKDPMHTKVLPGFITHKFP